MEAEATMICVDNSRWMNPAIFQEQADAIQYYCNEKLNANPRNVVGIASMSDYRPYYYRNSVLSSIATYPTRDLNAIMRAVYALRIGGELQFVKSAIEAHIVWRSDLLNQDRDLKKRIVVFAGGNLYDDTADFKRLGLRLKKLDIAFDAVDFAPKSSRERTELFETLVAAAGNSCNIFHVEPHMSISEALSSSQIIPARVGGSSSRPLDIKDKKHYSQISYVSYSDVITRSILSMRELLEERENAAREAAQAEAKH